MSRRRRAAAGWICAVVVWSGAAPAAAPRAAAGWNVVLRLEADGEYRSESIRTRTDGSYSVAFEWTGMLEKDELDFLLVHKTCVLKSWKIEERTTEGEIIRMTTDRDATDTPELKVNYVLNEGGLVHFDFAVAGFDVPLSGSEESFPLVFPASAESGAKSGTVAYNAAVRSGSNDIAVEAEEIRSGRTEGVFAWTWLRQAWIQTSDALVFQSNGHKAKVTLTIVPQEPL
jgi:hypothetical protein